MKERKKIAIFIDYSLRIPSFKESYEIFKSSLFKDNLETTFEDELTLNDPRFYWQRQVANPEILKFYMSKNFEKIDNTKVLGKFQEYFFNIEHYSKFLEEYSFNLYADCQVPSMSDINYINVSQSQLFDVILVDRYENSRKINNTFFFLSKLRIYPQTVTFLSPSQELKTENYLGIWDPMTNTDQINMENSTSFLEWLKELEKQVK